MINALLYWLFSGSHFGVRPVVVCYIWKINVAERQRSHAAKYFDCL